MRQKIGYNFLKVDQIETSYSYPPLFKAFIVLKLEGGSNRLARELQAPEIARFE